MNSDDKFWISIWSIVALTIILVVVYLFIYSYNKKELIAQTIDKGHDPMEVYCALDNSSSYDTVLCQSVITIGKD